MSLTPADRARRIRLLVTDVDGVLTDGRLHFGPGGEVFKTFNAKDGYGLRQLTLHDVHVAVLSGRASEAVTRRMDELGITEVHQGHRDKLPVLERLLSKFGLEPGQAAFVGDDALDVPAMRHCGLAAAVADAHPDAIAAAHLVTSSPGGAGAVREVCDLILEAQTRTSRASR